MKPLTPTQGFQGLVVHTRDPHDVYVGRPSPFGNPFSHKTGTLAEFQVATKEEAIRRFEKWLLEQPALVARVKRQLRGKVLGCWCKPGPCHGDVLARIANEDAGPPRRLVSSYDPVAHGARCNVCPLKGKPVVPPTPATKPLRLVIVGEGPGYREELEGKSFIGPSGQLLDRELAKAGFPDRSEAHVTNGHLCRPEGDKQAELAAACCAPRLLRELKELSPTVPILALGKLSTKAIVGARSILVARGFVWTAKSIDPTAVRAAHRAHEKAVGEKRIPALLKALVLEGRAALAGRVVLPTIHPAFVLRADVWLPVMRADFRRMVRLVKGELTTDKLADNGKYVVVSKVLDVKRALSKLGKVVSFDIETDGVDPLKAEILCVGVADRKRVVVIQPWRAAVHAKIFNRWIREDV